MMAVLTMMCFIVILPSLAAQRQSPLKVDAILVDGMPKVTHARALARREMNLAEAIGHRNRESERESHNKSRDVKFPSQANTGTCDGKRVAVFVSGALQRYEPDSSATHLISPMVRAGCHVDHYMSLNINSVPGWVALADHFVMDQRYQGLEGKQLEHAIVQPLAAAGARISKLILSAEVDGSRSTTHAKEQAFLNGTSKLGEAVWKGYKHAQQARRNWLHRAKDLETLWKEATATEQRERKQYDLVIVIYDDAVWARDFDLMSLLRSEVLPASGGLGAYSLDCGQWDLPPGQLRDWIWILERQAAVPFLTEYSLMLEPQPYTGEVNNSESFQKVKSDYYHVHMLRIPAAKIPLQRVDRLWKDGNVTRCYHKKCNSNVFATFPLCDDLVSSPRLPKVPKASRLEESVTRSLQTSSGLSYIWEGQMVSPPGVSSQPFNNRNRVAVFICSTLMLTTYGLRTRIERLNPLALSLVLWGCSSIGMNIVNKLALTIVPLPLTLLVMQMIVGATVAFIFLGGCDLVDEIMKKKQNAGYWALLTLPFTGMLVSSMLAVQSGSVTFVLVTRNMLPLVSLFAESFLLPGSAPPITVQGILSLFTVSIGTWGYGYSSLRVQPAGTKTAAFWIAVNMVMTVTHRLLERSFLVDKKMTLSFGAMALLNNTVPILPIICFLTHRGEFSEYSSLVSKFVQTDVLQELSSITSLLLSAFLGLSLGYWSVVVQKQVSATTMLTLQTAGKVSTILLATSMLGDSCPVLAALGIAISLAGTAWYSVSLLK